MTTEVKCFQCSNMTHGKYTLDDKPICVACVIAESNDAMKELNAEERERARQEDSDYDSDDWNSEDEEEEEESCVQTIWYGP